MGCCSGDREKAVTEEQKWDYITLSDFRSKSCIAPFSYMWLWILAFISIAVYVADTFTAVNLIAFNRWSSQVEPTIPFEVSKWIFFVCICLSWALAAIEWIRAIRVMRKGGVADSYLDPLAAVLQSIRVGKGQGWRRFLVFAELTKSKKGVDYIALFVYFQFKGAFRIILAEGPRQVVNALTLYSVMKLDLIPEGEHASSEGRSPIEQFFVNIEALADSNHEQAVILSSMLFTLVIWVIAALSLLVAVIFYILFLWHYIPSADGTLSRYCRRKVDSRLDKIVSVKVKKALQRDEAKRRKEEQKFANKANKAKNGEKLPAVGLAQKPTLPSVLGDDDARSEFSLSRQDSFATLPPYASQPPTRTNTMTTTSSARRPFPPTRTATQSSNASYGSNAPLLGDASPMGFDEPGRRSPMPPLPPLDTVGDYRGAPMNRPITPSSAGTPRPYSPMGRSGTPQGRNSPMGMRPNGGPPLGPSRLNTGFSNDGRNSPGPNGPMGPSRLNTGFSNDGRNSPGPNGPMGQMSRQNTYGSLNVRQAPGPSPLASDPGFSPYDRRSPAPGPAYEMSPVEAPRQPPSFSNQGYTASPVNDDDYDPYRPMSTEPVGPARAYNPYSPTSAPPMNAGPRPGPTPQPRPLPSAVLQSAIQRREGANSVPPQHVQRSVTAPMNGPMYAQQSPSPVPRAATAVPSQRGPPFQREDGW